MLPRGRFGQDRHKPAGDWVQTTSVESVVGIQHRRSAAEAFVTAACRAEHAGLAYGLRIEAEPRNPHDPNALKVIGFAEVKGWFRQRHQEWHVGYVNAAMAAELGDALVARGIPVAAELYSLWVGDDGFIDVRFIVLAPPGHSHSKRQRAKQGGDQQP